MYNSTLSFDILRQCLVPRQTCKYCVPMLVLPRFCEAGYSSFLLTARLRQAYRQNKHTIKQNARSRQQQTVPPKAFPTRWDKLHT